MPQAVSQEWVTPGRPGRCYLEVSVGGWLGAIGRHFRRRRWALPYWFGLLRQRTCESESADRVCRDGLRAGREAPGARHGELP